MQEWALHDNCVWVNFGIPCGTSSRARDIRMSQYDHGPPPLRTQSYPGGLSPHLMSKKNLPRVRSANRLYRFMAFLILSLPLKTIWTIENPFRSWLWQTSYFRSITNRLQTFFGRFDMCIIVVDLSMTVCGKAR